ncbi:MAG: sugar phosphate isomerase/epimerase [Spirochaetales bacterium]|nr:sugar phosphate isomerase/epimerase [Spirochaetales bacterium]
MEIASFGTYCFHFNFGSPSPAELRIMLDDFGLTPIGLNFFTDFKNAWNEQNIDLFSDEWERKIAQLPEVGIPMMTMSFGARNDRPDLELQLSNAVKAYNRVGRIAEKYQVRMLLEVPHLYGLMPGTEEVLWVFDRLESSNVGALVDSSHWGIIGYDIDEFFTALGDRLWHIHLRDSIGPDTADRKQQLELTAGNGTVDFRKFGSALDNVHYQGEVSIEFEYRDKSFEEIEREYDKGLGYLKEIGWQLPATMK